MSKNMVHALIESHARLGNKPSVKVKASLLAVFLLTFLLSCQSSIVITKTKFEWKDTGQYSQCSVTCGSGHEMTSVVCREARTGSRVREVNCYKSNSVKPAPKVRECLLASCRPMWIVDGEWSTCSASCADDTGGVSTRLVYCVEELSDGSTQRTLDKLCNSNEKPVTERSCSSDVECPKWIAGQWSPCSVTCGSGHQDRIVLCQTTGIVGCDADVRPPTQSLCHRRSCDGDDVGYISTSDEDRHHHEHRSRYSSSSSSSGSSRDFTELSMNPAVGVNEYDVIDERGTETSELGGRGGVLHAKIHSDRRLPASPWHFPRKSWSGAAPSTDKATTVSGNTTAMSSADNKTKKSFRSSVQVVVSLDRDERYNFIPVVTKTTTPGPRLQVESTSSKTLKRNDVIRGKSFNEVPPKVGGDDDEQASYSGEVELSTRTTTTNVMTSQRRKPTATIGSISPTSSLTTLITTRSAYDERDFYRSVTSSTSSNLNKLNSSASHSSPRYKWRISSDFTPCSVSCGEQSHRLRRVECVARHVVGFVASGYDRLAHPGTDRTVEYDVIMPEYSCRGLVKPTSIEPCFVAPCRSAAWITTEWSQCSTSCGVVGVRTRKVQCAWQPVAGESGGDVALADDVYCSHLERPPTERKCTQPPCTSHDCRDRSHYCSLVPQMSLCHLTQYRQRCCYSCQTSRRSRHVRRLLRFQRE